MKKKKLKGFHKTRHFLERQKQREVSDQDVIRAIRSGELIEKDFSQSFKLGHLSVTIDLINSILITVHPGDPSSKKSKLLTKEEANTIRELIRKHEARKISQTESSSNDFLKYVEENAIKKIE